MRLIVILTAFFGLAAPLTHGVDSRVTADEGACVVRADKIVTPATAIIGHEVEVMLRVEADCERQQLPLHVVLVVDNSSAMGGRRMADLRGAVGAFVDALEMPPSKAGLVTYASAVELLAELTGEPDVVKAATERFFPRHGSNLLGALRSGHQALSRARDGPAGDVLEVMIVISGSEPDDAAASLVVEADAIKADGVLLVTIAAAGFADAATLEQMASSGHFYVEGQGSRYASLMEEIAGAVSAVQLTSATVTDELPDTMTYVWGSGMPAPRMQGSRLNWSYASWPAQGITITYGIEPTELGAHASSNGAEVALTFDRGQPIREPFPNPVIIVVPEPTITPTSSQTPDPPTATHRPPTSTPTPRPAHVYLPLLLRHRCAPSGSADVVFVIDASHSMMERAHGSRVKLELVQIAATDLVWALEASGHRAAVVTFADDGRVRHELTEARVPIEIALSRVYDDVGAGSRLDNGLALALSQLIGTDADPSSLPVVVVITDGFAPFDLAMNAAVDLRDVGVAMYAVGIGPQVSLEELTELTGSHSRAAHSADGGALGDDLKNVGQAIDCAVRSVRRNSESTTP